MGRVGKEEPVWNYIDLNGDKFRPGDWVRVTDDGLVRYGRLANMEEWPIYHGHYYNIFYVLWADEVVGGLELNGRIGCAVEEAIEPLGRSKDNCVELHRLQ